MTSDNPIRDSKHDWTIRRPQFRALELLDPVEVWRTLKRTGNAVNYRRFTYKYRSPDEDRLRGILIDSKVYLSSPASFNDPFDMQARVVFAGTPQQKRAEVANKIKRGSRAMSWRERQRTIDDIMAHPERTERNARDAFIASTVGAGVCSFADDPKSILMWSHYASHHTGVCIQFDVAASATRLTAATRVTYSDKYPTFNFAEDTKAQLLTVLLQKSCHWQYERERRLICPQEANTLYPFGPRACSAVIIGCRAEAAVEPFLEECNAERVRRGMPAFRIYRAVRSQTRYALEIHPIRRGG